MTLGSRLRGSAAQSGRIPPRRVRRRSRPLWHGNSSCPTPRQRPPLPWRQSAIGSAKYLAASQIVRTALMLLSTLLVARLLTPDDYGVVAMCAPFLALVVLVQDLGLGIATVQARALTPAQSSAAFWINVLAALVLALGIVAAAPLVASTATGARWG
ncbi:oligosaccharide flippase family protein [Sphingomonas sp. MMS24-JH45]